MALLDAEGARSLKRYWWVDLFSSFSLGLRRNRCRMLLQLSDSNCVTLDVLLRTYLRRVGALVAVVERSDAEVAIGDRSSCS